jgi:hypothetical protein
MPIIENCDELHMYIILTSTTKKFKQNISLKNALNKDGMPSFHTTDSNE